MPNKLDTTAVNRAKGGAMWGLQFCVWFHGARGSAARCDTHTPAGQCLGPLQSAGKGGAWESVCPCSVGGTAGERASTGDLARATAKHGEGRLLPSGQGACTHLLHFCTNNVTNRSLKPRSAAMFARSRDVQTLWQLCWRKNESKHPSSKLRKIKCTVAVHYGDVYFDKFLCGFSSKLCLLVNILNIICCFGLVFFWR